MPPLLLNGPTLGNRHQYFNTQVNEAIKNKTPFETILSEPNLSDVDHLFKIDIASNYRNVQYIIDTLKSDDLLHVSRAIKKSSWLITEDQYSHIINPQYLYTELFPYMTARAINKLLLHIRLTLKNDKRGDEFYKYYEESDVKLALKWLPNCSLEVIEKAIDKHSNSIEPNLFKKLCEKFPEVFNIYVSKNKNTCSRNHFEVVIHLLNSDTINYLDLVEKLENWYWPKFNKQHTTLLMKRCPERILNKFSKYYYYVHIETVAKYMDQSKIKEFLLTLSKNKDMEYWMTYQNIKPFIKYMPKEGKFEFLKRVFIDKKSQEPDNTLLARSDALCEYSLGNIVKSENIYQWYRHAPFNIAFEDLKKIIKTESSPDERAAILRVMLTTAGRDTSNIAKVLQYYRDRHINEPFKYKINFINFLLTITCTFKYDEASWKILDELFHSAEVYMESQNNVQHCIEVIIVYKILHKQPIPDIIEKKFNFNPLKKIKNKLNENEKTEIFTYLLNYIQNKIKSQSIEDQDGINKLNVFITDAMDLLLDWDKDLSDFQFVLDKIQELIILKHDKDKTVNLENIYNKKKSWRKVLFQESLLMSRSENVYVNVLKHDPTLLQKHLKEVSIVRSDDDIVLLRFLSKLKIYWSESLAQDWANSYRILITEPKGHKALTRGLCGLLPRKELLEVFDKYAPNEPKINWGEIDELLLSLRKNFAQLMYNARPQPPPSTILRYAHGDYLQFALPSVNAIFYNISSQNIRGCLSQILQSAVSLQKHGIRIAFSKLTSDEVKKIFSDIWKSSKNISIKAVIFQLTFDLLCKEKTNSKIEEIWSLLEMFIDNLSHEENAKTYNLLGSVNMIPKLVKGKFCMKSYTFLKSLPAKCNCGTLLENVTRSIPELIDSVDPDFVASILMEFVNGEYFEKKIIARYYEVNNDYKDLLVKYLLCSQNEEEQKNRYKKVIKPWLAQVFTLWDKVHNNENYTQKYFNDWIGIFTNVIRDNFVNKKYVNPTKIIQEIGREIETNLPPDSSYYFLVMCKLLTAYTLCYERVKLELADPKDDDESCDDKKLRYQDMWRKIAPLFAVEVVKLLKEDVEKLFPSIWIIFSKSLQDMYNIASYETEDFVFEKELLKDENCVLSCLLAVKILPHRFYDDEKDKKLNKIRRIIINNPSNEVRMHYYKKYYDNPVMPLEEEVDE